MNKLFDFQVHKFRNLDKIERTALFRKEIRRSRFIGTEELPIDGLSAQTGSILIGFLFERCGEGSMS